MQTCSRPFSSAGRHCDKCHSAKHQSLQDCVNAPSCAKPPRAFPVQCPPPAQVQFRNWSLAGAAESEHSPGHLPDPSYLLCESSLFSVKHRNHCTMPFLHQGLSLSKARYIGSLFRSSWILFHLDFLTSKRAITAARRYNVPTILNHGTMPMMFPVALTNARAPKASTAAVFPKDPNTLPR